ncbi:GNAT family N-acetyltransferase [Janibacter limosus]|uniref:GNAT family N-acetyltransferase n=1 Tax=Janibacter limosus TaxID=53458 RepID=A0AC61U6G3_9MICO|nr:GNAT family N-acetyltransferase [Janibacter limosus]UUZ45611.1 GNAT family N-acetyltransferase [Janibacter limosus]
MAPRPRRLPRRTPRDRGREPAPGPVEGSVIRPAVPGDIATIIALRALMFEAMGTSAEAISDIDWQQDASRWLQQHLTDERVHVVVAEANGTVVSCAIGQVLDLMPSPTRTGGGGLVTNIATFPRHRRLGFTHAVPEALLGWFEEETDVEVITLNATEAGRDIYDHFGFVASTFPEMRLRLERPAEPDED